MPAVHLPSDEAVQPPALGAVPAAPKVPSLAGIEEELGTTSATRSSPPASATSVPPPASPSIRVPPPAAARSTPPLSPLAVSARPVSATSSAPPAIAQSPAHSTPTPLVSTQAPNTTTVVLPPLESPSKAQAASPSPVTKSADLTTPATPATPAAHHATNAIAPAPAATPSAAALPTPAKSVVPPTKSEQLVRLFASESKSAAPLSPIENVAENAEIPAIFGSNSIAPPTPEAQPQKQPEKQPDPKRDRSSSSHVSATEPTPPARPRSMPPPPSIAVDPTIYEEASRKQSTNPQQQAPTWKSNAALALSLIGVALGGAALYRSFSTANRATVVAPLSATTVSDDRPTSAPATRAQLDEAIERSSAELAVTPTKSLAKIRRSRLLALRAEYLRGIAEDLDALAAAHAGDEATLDRAEARLLRRQAAQDAARASADAASVRSEVPPAESRREWTLALAHAAIAADPTSAEAMDYVNSARTAGAPVRWLEALAQRARNQSAESALEQALGEQDAPAFARLALARAARQAQRLEDARRHLAAAREANGNDEAVRSLASTISDGESATPTPTTAPTAEPAPPNTAQNEASAASEPAAQQGAAPAEYLARVQAGRRALAYRLLPRARMEFRRALAVKADGVEAQIGLAWVALRIGYYSAAVQSFRRLYSQGHSTPEVRVGLGLAHAKMRDRESAVRYLRAYLAGNPQGPLAQEARQTLAALGAS